MSLRATLKTGLWAQQRVAYKNIFAPVDFLFFIFASVDFPKATSLFFCQGPTSSNIFIELESENVQSHEHINGTRMMFSFQNGCFLLTWCWCIFPATFIDSWQCAMPEFSMIHRSSVYNFAAFIIICQKSFCHTNGKVNDIVSCFLLSRYQLNISCMCITMDLLDGSGRLLWWSHLRTMPPRFADVEMRQLRLWQSEGGSEHNKDWCYLKSNDSSCRSFDFGLWAKRGIKQNRASDVRCPVAI